MEPPSLNPATGEFALIDRYFARAAGSVGARPDVIAGIGDDAALLRVPDAADLVAAVDTLVEGRHFPPGSAPHSIGYRALAVNLSDLAAMGATPAWATLALTMPDADASWLAAFSDGLLQVAETHDVALVGGDTTRGPLTISVQILGWIARGTALRRSGARAGDLIAVTGTLGDAGAGLALLMQRMRVADRTAEQELIRRFEYPAPRVAFGASARGTATAAMDLSDGLIGDLPKLAAASGLAATVDVARLPLSPALRMTVPPESARDFALAGGDDYELLVTVPPAGFERLSAVAQQLNLTLTAIGELHAGSGVRWSLDGLPYSPSLEGYDHFR